jgi:hypothetical protein
MYDLGVKPTGTPFILTIFATDEAQRPLSGVELGVVLSGVPSQVPASYESYDIDADATTNLFLFGDAAAPFMTVVAPHTGVHRGVPR